VAKIGDLISSIRYQNLVLPQFQREYVWNYDQAKELIVSLYKDYPTGSLLFWTTANPPELKNIDFPQNHLGAINVILDGQQRLTTLYLFIENQIPPYYLAQDIRTDPRELYFDLDSAEFQYYQSGLMQNNPSWVKVTDCFASSSSVKPHEIAQKKFPTEKPIEELFSLVGRYTDHLTKLQNVLKTDYPIQTVPPEANIDAAIDIFDRVNSQGTKLTDAELALTHITGKWPKARQEMKRKIDHLRVDGFAFNLTFMVRSLVGVVHERALFELIHKTDAEKIIDGWDRLTKILDYLVDILKGHAYIHSTDDLNTTNVFVPIVVYLARHDGKFPDNKELKHAIHWIYAANMWGRYSSQTDQKLDHDISTIKRDGSPWKELVDAIIEQRGRIKVEPSDLEGRDIRHPIYRMMFIIAKTRGAVDWFNGSTFTSLGSVENHDIFPGTFLYKAGKYNPRNHLHRKLVTEITNRFFLHKSSTLKEAEPAIYLKETDQRYSGALAKQFIPDNSELWKTEYFEQFLTARRKLIADAINNYMDQLITEPVPEPENTLEDFIKSGESASLEFKESLYFGKAAKERPDLQKKIFKTLAGFFNVEGGTLLIGVKDDGNILGVEHCLEPEPQKMSPKDRDNFGLDFTGAFSQYFSSEFLPYINLSWAEHSNHTVAIVKVDPSPKPVYLADKKLQSTEFYIRAGAATKLLDVEEAHIYINMNENWKF
jgi:hypothetical protein